MAVYLLCPARWRPAAVLSLSLFYLMITHPLFLLYMAGVAALDWIALLIMGKYDDNPFIRGLCLAFSLFKNLGCIFLFGGVLAVNQTSFTTMLGLYVITLSALSCVLEVYRRTIPDPGSPVHFALYCFYFPRLAAGPLIPYRDFARQLESPETTPGDIGGGLLSLIGGAIKLRILGEGLLILYTDLRGVSPSDESVIGLWVMVAALGLSVYFHFSGVTDMARGAGRMMGITLPENFRHPFESTSITDFFGRFNASLTDYVIHVFGPRFAALSRPLAGASGLMVIALAGGLWFGFSFGRIAWGIFLGLFLVMERYLYPAFVRASHKLLALVYTQVIVLVSFVLFDARDFDQLAGLARGLFGMGNLPLDSERLIYLLSSNRLLLVAGVLFATSTAGRLFALLRERSLIGYRIAGGLSGILLLILLTAFAI